MTEMLPLAGRAVWYGRDLDRSGAWIRSLDDTHRAEIDAALARVKRDGLPSVGFGRADFPLASTAALLAEIGDELENGLGAVRLRGLPVERYSDDDIRRVFWGLGCYLGTPLYQNARGEIMGEVRDETGLAEKTYAPSEPGRVVSSRARARSTGPLRWHTDRCDVIALLCVRNAKAGGISKLTSIVTIYNGMRDAPSAQANSLIRRPFSGHVPTMRLHRRQGETFPGRLEGPRGRPARDRSQYLRAPLYRSPQYRCARSASPYARVLRRLADHSRLSCACGRRTLCAGRARCMTYRPTAPLLRQEALLALPSM